MRVWLVAVLLVASVSGCGADAERRELQAACGSLYFNRANSLLHAAVGVVPARTPAAVDPIFLHSTDSREHFGHARFGSVCESISYSGETREIDLVTLIRFPSDRRAGEALRIFIEAENDSDEVLIDFVEDVEGFWIAADPDDPGLSYAGVDDCLWGFVQGGDAGPEFLRSVLAELSFICADGYRIEDG